MELDVVVATDEVLAAYPSLYHYTDRGGFEGILKSRSLWATFYKDLNDTQEVNMLRAPLVEALSAEFVGIVRRRHNRSLKLDRFIKRAGGFIDAARIYADSLASALYESAFDHPDGNNLVDLYILSFCSHNEPYERENGLLSQWRGYSGNGGYCILFNSRGLVDLLTKECAMYYYIQCAIWPVKYANKEVPIREMFPTLIDGCADVLDDVLCRLQDGTAEIDGMTLLSFLTGAALYKHQAFREEEEVRLIVAPGNNYAKIRISEEHPEVEFGPIKKVHSRPLSGGAPKRFVKVFEGLHLPLPIERVIVGPSRHQRENADWARRLVGPGVQVICSETPYLPPS